MEDKGIEKGILNSIRNLMDSMKLSAKQAMSVLSVPENKHEKYENLLNKQMHNNS